MNKKFIYPLMIVLFCSALAFIFFRFKGKESAEERTFYELQERKGSMANTPEWAATRNTFETLSRAVRENPDDKKSALGIATVFIQEARVTGNYAYYDKAALKQINHVLQLEPNNFEALTLKSLVYLSQHHFADGLSIATQAQKINPNNSFIYGLLVDANVELGNYPEAVRDADKMVSIRPDLRSYSRISYLREIHGDYPGAIEAMQMAVDAGMPGEEGTEWTRVQLAHLYESTGDIQRAAMHYTIALNERPGYAYALAGLGKIAASKKDFKTALADYLRADSLLSDYSVREELIDLYRQMGEKKKADSLSAVVIAAMQSDVRAGISNENIGHYADKELAYANLKINENDKALEHAIAEYNRRPDNIETNETVAWVYYKMGRYEDALPYIGKALRTDCKNPSLLGHAGLIYTHAGNTAKGKDLLTEALGHNPLIAADLQEECQHVLMQLKQTISPSKQA